MSEDMDKSIKQAIEMISKPETLKGLLSVLGNTDSKPSTNQTQNQLSTDKKNENTLLGTDMDENVELLRKVKEVVSTLDSRNDPRINLLSAITPFMNKKRQKAVNDCVQLLRVSQLLPVILKMNNHKSPGT
ncbi:hypothetical protein RBH29_10460 [Herbivorax sp. ANBcel31]|uniref:hypothetical protein n=1 Tax=Herbivorax sp. ANBcel31 TaxID=3069754 RepID=UPI0027B667E5|nr:hypothetical protein [Herbivorax sp. ANBcel31]MDQ2086847.1 hypothetical protein [Herbivorax sp. ANBcel31]